MEEIKVPGKSNTDIEKTATKYAVKNAYEHEGRAEVGAVVGKVKALFPDVIIGQVMPIITKVVSEVNGLKKEELKERYELFKTSRKRKSFARINLAKKRRKNYDKSCS